MKKWIKRFLVVLGLWLCVIVAFWQYGASRDNAKLKSLRAKLDETESGWRLEEVVNRYKATLPPDEENVATYALRARKEIPRTYFNWYDTVYGRANSTYEVEGRLAPELFLVEARKQLHEIKSALSHFDKGRTFHRGGFAYDPFQGGRLESVYGQAESMCTLGKIFNVKAIVAANDGDTTAAVDALRARLHLAKAFGHTPRLHAQDRRAWYWLDVSKSTVFVINLTIDGADYATLQDELTTALSEDDGFLDGLEGERAWLDWKLELVASGQVPFQHLTNATGGLPRSLRNTTLSEFALRSSLRACQISTLEYLTAAINIYRKIAPERFHIPPTWRVQSGSTYDSIMDSLLDDVWRGSLKRGYQKAHYAATVAGIACERFRMRNGRWPHNLHEIPKSILPTIPNDLFANEPIRMAQTGRGIVLYSVGPDRKDDGGKFGFFNHHDVDLGIVLIDPVHRRKPPAENP
jgi:hypothetical protein